MPDLLNIAFVENGETLRDWLSIVLSIIALRFAWLGLNTWREQLHGKQQWETVSSLMAIAFKLLNIAKLSKEYFKRAVQQRKNPEDNNIWQHLLKIALDTQIEGVDKCANELYRIKSDVAVHISPYHIEHVSALMRLANAMTWQLNYLATGLGFILKNPNDKLHHEMCNNALDISVGIDFTKDISTLLSQMELDFDNFFPKNRKSWKLNKISKWPEFTSEKKARFFNEFSVPATEEEDQKLANGSNND